MNQQRISNQYEVELHNQILKLFHKSDLRMHDNILGSKVYTNYQRVALIVLFQRSRKAPRDFVSELKESRWVRWIGLREIPNFTTLSRWIKKFNMSKLRQFLTKTVSEEKPSLMAIDATGFDSWQRSRHYERRLRDFKVRNPHLPYAKADILVDTNNKLIYDVVLRMKPRHDTLGASTIIKRLKHKHVLILADRGYDSEPLHELVAKSGNLMFAPIRDFRVRKIKGKHRRRCEEGHIFYSQRNIVESVNFSLKSRFRSLRSKLHFMKKREFMWKVITYNLEKLSQRVNSLLRLIFQLLFCNRAKFK